MEFAKCRKCSLVNSTSHAMCRRCGTVLGAINVKKVKGPREAASGAETTLIKVVAVFVAALFVFNYFSAGESEPPKEAMPNTTTAAQPLPTLGLRSEYEQKQIGSFKTALQSSPDLNRSQKRLEEAQKLMQPAAKQ